jgi:CheY-like chemotaxis protein
MESVRVLLVEDDEDNRELMTEVLETAGYEVVTAASGAEGLRKLSEQPMDAVLTDVGMPGMGGLEVAQAAKRIAAGVPVVIITGYAEREDIQRARERDVDAVLVKPVDPDLLTECLAGLLKARA